jgi:hypothetical protein
MDNGNTLLRLTNGDVVESLILYPSFKDLIDKVEHTMEIILDNNN